MATVWSWDGVARALAGAVVEPAMAFYKLVHIKVGPQVSLTSTLHYCTRGSSLSRSVKNWREPQGRSAGVCGTGTDLDSVAFLVTLSH